MSQSNLPKISEELSELINTKDFNEYEAKIYLTIKLIGQLFEPYSPWMSCTQLKYLLYQFHKDVGNYNNNELKELKTRLDNFDKYWFSFIDKYNKYLIKHGMVMQIVRNINTNQIYFNFTEDTITISSFDNDNDLNEELLKFVSTKLNPDNNDSGYFFRIKWFDSINTEFFNKCCGFLPSIDDLCFYYRYLYTKHGVPTGLNDETSHSISSCCPGITGVGIGSPSNVVTQPNIIISFSTEKEIDNNLFLLCCGDSSLFNNVETRIRPMARY